MASWTDKPVGFNPYIQQMPIEQMLQIGVNRQQKYDEGLQRIQSTIDNIAGMDVVRDVDKQYLQSKLHNITSDLKMVAAADFSNYQLVNSVGGMVNQIAKDENVINAVSSTRYYRKGLSDMDSFNKQGKGSPSNDWYFNSQVSEWLNSGDVKQSFNGKYTPYTDYKKTALEVIKSLTGNKTITEDAFTTNEKGQLVLSDAILRTEFEGVSPEQIQQALLVGMTPADMRQMEIDGLYNYSNVDGETFAKTVTNSFSNQFDSIREKRNFTSKLMEGTKDPQEKNKLRGDLNALDKELEKVQKTYSDIARTFEQGDADSAKAKLYSYDFMNNFSNAFSFAKSSQEYKTSPLAQISLERDKEEATWKRFWKNYNLDVAKFKLSQDELDFEKLKEANKNIPFGNMPAGASSDELPIVTMDKFRTNTTNSLETIKRSDEAQAKYFNQDATWMNDMYERWKRNDKIDDKLASYFRATDEQRVKNDIALRTVADIQKKADEKFGTTANIAKQLPPQYNKPVEHLSKDGRQYVYNSEEIIELNSRLKNYIIEPAAAGYSPTLDIEKAKNELSEKEFEIFNVFAKKFNGEKLTDSEKNLAEIRTDIYKLTDQSYNQLLNEKNESMMGDLQTRILTPQGNFQGVNLEQGKRDAFSSSVIVPVITQAEEMTDGWPNSPQFSPETARKIMEDPNYTATYRRVQGTDFSEPIYEVVLEGKGASTKFKLSPEQNTYVFMNRFEPDAVTFETQEAEQAMMATGSTTTAFDGMKTNTKNAYYHSHDFSGVNYYGLTGNIVQTSDGYVLEVNIYDPVKDEWSEGITLSPDGQSFSLRQAMAFKNRLTDTELYYYLNGENPDNNKLMELQKARKKLNK